MFGFNQSQVKAISPKDAYERLNADKDIILLDVRSPEEYKEKHIPRSINLPLNMMAKAEEMLPEKDRTIFVYCLSGARSSNACKLLEKFGYTSVYNMGGINSWFYETVSGK